MDLSFRLNSDDGKQFSLCKLLLNEELLNSRQEDGVWTLLG